MLEEIFVKLNRKQKLLVLDLDDTLVDTSHVYWLARSQFLGILADEGFDASVALHVFEQLDTENIKILGYVPERYRVTMQATYGHLANIAGYPTREAIQRKINAAADIIIKRIPSLITGARALLHFARKNEFKVSLLTRGIEAVQKQKLRKNKIEALLDDIEVVPRKDKQTFINLASRLGHAPQDVWIVGDSVRSDINPGIEAGNNCILYLYTHHSYHWVQEYGIEPKGPFYLARSHREVIDILRAPGLHQRRQTVPTREAEIASL
jgi:putative hydrolase of the HAD superfamily